MDEFSPRARRRSALLTWQHIASLPPSLPVVYCGGFNTQKESTTGRFLLGRSREHGVVGDMRDAWPNSRLRKNMSLIRTYHGFKGNKQGTLEFLKLIFRALCLCWDRQTQDLHIDWILFRGRSLAPVSCEVVNDNIDGHYPSSHYPIFAEFMLPRTVRPLDPPAVSFAAKEIDIVEWKGDMLAVGVTEKDMTKDNNSKFQNSILKKLDSQHAGLLFQVSAEEDFTGKPGQSTVLRLSGHGPKRVGLFGLGKCTTSSTTPAYRALGESIASSAKAYQANNVAIILASSEDLTPVLKLTAASAIATGTLLGTYEDTRFKSESKKPTLKSVDFLGLGVGPELEKKLKYTEHVFTGVVLGKELVNSPANVLTPVALAQEAEKIASTYHDVFSVKI
ncbi:hypothetical protein L1987_29832 [Smallanthus sonchifolius]|uniref:Uncharacterized protein n=1 Tax=Smallanthus sonchifolius TaxID=185202 RepID=A0ACB9I116_9ASTR|nr:hypothetical protein L1987_29832 [Smallanthus sonchifolius]